ncbi:1,4-benzoquinone reductase [Coprinopsis cinerea okayama7|uniref:1,4-benzoquinone reductase n=1 Tax=Coprinopsis cinerea (strain Okayama-7 / 130 / ATCC MYA-4618 / FGSC 9003) TaxID=240176 RepID=A8P8W2_COPC7|nr:1,4-benzoquinone reductase [Coprinopsis cinerea okayama7\|eukprot:XP_001839648.2 1,4-benzoquinone reductase [Coprinopsis cinerea okayama7\
MAQRAPKVGIIIFSMYGHVAKLAEAERAGIMKAGGTAEIYQFVRIIWGVAETLSPDVLAKMKAPPKPNYPIITTENIQQFDAMLFGIPTRYGNFPAQWKVFWDATGRLWTAGKLSGKYAGVFISTGTMGGGQETTAISTMSTLMHHGMIFVPLGYAHSFDLMSRMDEVRGGSPWGAGTFAGGDGSRMPSQLELDIAEIQGKAFWETVSRVRFG